MSDRDTSNTCIGIGALSAMTAVGAGAFGAHALKQMLSPEMLNTYHTAVDYQFLHSVGLILVGILNRQAPRACHKTIAVFMFCGIVLFSGSLYFLSLSGIKWLGMITPLGGICFIIAWLLLGFHYLFRPEGRP